MNEHEVRRQSGRYRREGTGRVEGDEGGEGIEKSKRVDDGRGRNQGREGEKRSDGENRDIIRVGVDSGRDRDGRDFSPILSHGKEIRIPLSEGKNKHESRSEKGSETKKRKWDDIVSDVERESWEKKIRDDAAVLSFLEEKPPSCSASDMQFALDTVRKLYLQEPWNHETATPEIKTVPPVIFPALHDVMRSNIYMLGEQMKLEYENIMIAATKFYHLQYMRNQLIIDSAGLDVMKETRPSRNSGCRCGCQG